MSISRSVARKLIGAILAAAATSALLGGCASAGNQVLRTATQADIDQRIIKGRTTKADVVAYLGAAESVSFTDSGLEIWTYTFASNSAKPITFIPVVGMLAGGSDVDKRQLTILFNQKDIVSKATYSASTSEVRTGLLK
ncbi:hypothetical protein [Pandoraea communis]|uniref:hypothetical protein n=1 Tax=Pandoraea communis TaxID=2508297 RepID=UPI0025A4EC22|nr:hypothetical protein [Pandoraea communis]MDM8356600.1 hypothetical protein [Pandoraea communis]